MDKYQLYDNIISATYTNLAIDVNKNGGIFFNSFDKNSVRHQFFLKIAFMVANFENTKIYLNCKIFDFLKILFSNYTIKEILFLKFKIRPHTKKNTNYTDIDFFSAFTARGFQQDLTIFEEIWKEYYQK